MAKIDAPSKSGSVGLSTFLSSPHGLIERRRVLRPYNPRTLAQQTVRGLVRAFAGEWRELDDPARASWRALARQLPGRLGGSHAFTKVNVTRVYSGLPKMVAAPPLPVFGRLLCTGLVADDTPNLTLTGLTATVAPEVFIVEATPPLSPGISFVGRRWRHVSAMPGHAGSGIDVDLTGAYLLRFNAPKAGQRVFVRLSAMTNGIRDLPVEFNVLVAKTAE